MSSENFNFAHFRLREINFRTTVYLKISIVKLRGFDQKSFRTCVTAMAISSRWKIKSRGYIFLFSSTFLHGIARVVNYRLFDALGDAVMAKRESSERKASFVPSNTFRILCRVAAIIMKYR